MSSMVEEVIAIVARKEGDIPESQREAFNIRDLLSEIYGAKNDQLKIDCIYLEHDKSQVKVTVTDPTNSLFFLVSQSI